MNNTILTNIGRQKFLTATPESQIEIKRIILGDGGGEPVTVNPNMTWVVNEVESINASLPIRYDDIPDTLVFEGVSPAGKGGYTIREVGLVDTDGDLVAIGSTPTIVKPNPSAGGVEVMFRPYLKLDNASEIELIVYDADPKDHSKLFNRNKPNAHDASAISYKDSNVEEALDALRTLTFVTPEMFGAKGDGTTVDSEAFDSMVNAAGEGGVIHLSPEKVYLVDRPIYMLDYQTIVGNNATLRRVDQVVTTTTTSMSSASTTVSLASVAGFKVGQRVAFAQVGVARGSLTINSTLSIQRIITNISGNTITLNAAPGIRLDSGSTCFLAFNTLTMSEGCNVSGVRFDGNRSNWTFNRWEVICELDTDYTSFGQLVTNNLFVDSPSEAIIARSGDAVYSYNRFKDINGNAFHTSNARNNLIIGNHGVNGNLDMDVGHQDGFVSISLQNFNITIKDNIASQWVSGVSPISRGANANANFIISDNQFRDMYCGGIWRVSAPNVTITGNILDNIPTDPSKKAGLSEYSPISIHDSGKQNTTVSGNIVTNTLGTYSMFLNPSTTYDPIQQGSLKVFGNTVDGAVIAGGQDVQIQQNSIGGLLRVLNCRRFTAKDNTILRYIITSGIGEYIDVVLEGNSIIGGANGIEFSSNTSLYENITVKNNVLTGQTNRGIQTPGSGPDIKDFWITGNTIVAGENAPSDFIGIVATRDGITISGNKITALQTISNGRGISAGDNNINYTNLTITGNEVVGGWYRTIFLPSASTGVIVAHNTLQGLDVTGPVANAETYNVVY